MTSDDVPNLDLSCHFLHPATESSYLLPPPPILCLTTVAANWPVVSLNSVACVVEWMLLFYTSTAIAIVSLSTRFLLIFIKSKCSVSTLCNRSVIL